jgi:hypothetical protein
MHHDEKHHTSATITYLPNGAIQWTTPGGRTYISEPANRFLNIHDPGIHDVNIHDPVIHDVA